MMQAVVVTKGEDTTRTFCSDDCTAETDRDINLSGLTLRVAMEAKRIDDDVDQIQADANKYHKQTDCERALKLKIIKIRQASQKTLIM